MGLGEVKQFFHLHGEVFVALLNADRGVERGEGLIEPGAGKQDAGDLDRFVLIEDLEAGVFFTRCACHALGIEHQQEALPVAIGDSGEIKQGAAEAGSGLDMESEEVTGMPILALQAALVIEYLDQGGEVGGMLPDHGDPLPFTRQGGDDGKLAEEPRAFVGLSRYTGDTFRDMGPKEASVGADTTEAFQMLAGDFAKDEGTDAGSG